MQISEKKSSPLNDANFLKLIDKYCDSYEFCVKCKLPPLHSILDLTLVNVFNNVVCMNLKEHIFNKTWILHIIDFATKYSTAFLISSKH